MNGANPVQRFHSAHPVQRVSPYREALVTAQPTIFLAPAAEVLVQVEGRRAMPQLDVGKPFGDDAQQSRVEPDGSTNKRDDDPALGSIIRLPKAVAPAW